MCSLSPCYPFECPARGSNGASLSLYYAEYSVPTLKVLEITINLGQDARYVDKYNRH